MSVGPNLFYVHLPSCGGTTLWSVLGEVYGPEGVHRAVQNEQRQQAFARLRNLQKQFEKMRVIGGHVHYALARRQCPDRQMITILRDPVQRAISVYHRKVRNKKWTPRPHRDEHDIVDYCRKTRHDSQLARYLVDCGNQAVERGCIDVDPQAPVAELVASLSENFTAFGILEHFDRSLFLLAETLGWEQVPTYDVRNIGGNRPDTLTSTVIAELQLLLASELEVYRAASTLFEQRWQSTLAAAQPDLLRQFQQQNQHRLQRLLADNDNENPYVKHGQPSQEVNTGAALLTGTSSGDKKIS